MKLRHRISMLVLAGMLAAVSLGTVSATANNHKDTTFSFNFDYVNQMRYTESREKQDSSSMYAKNSRGAGFYAHAFAPGYIDKTNVRTPYAQPGGAAVFIYNNIYEDGYRAAILGARSTSSGSCNGLWSPDSV